MLVYSIIFRLVFVCRPVASHLCHLCIAEGLVLLFWLYYFLSAKKAVITIWIRIKPYVISTKYIFKVAK